MTTQPSRKGIILAGGSGSRLHPLTIAISKQLAPIYDKPMIYYPLSMLMLSGIREILVISTPHDLPLFKNLLKSGEEWGLKFTYAAQEKPEGLAQAFHIGADFLDGASAALVLGDNLFYGHNIQKALESADARQNGATVFAYHVSNPQDYGVVEFSQDGKVINIEEKPKQPRSNFAIPGLYFYDSTVVQRSLDLKPSARGELEITDLNRLYLEENQLFVENLGRGTAWLDTGTHDSMLDASNFVAAIQKRQNLLIASPEEIAFRKRWIDKNQLRAIAMKFKNSNYGRSLLSISSV